MEETSHSPVTDSGEEISIALSDLLSDSDTEGEISVREDMIEKLMQELYKEISYAKSPAEALPVISGSNGEICGASLSDSGSTVMAGVEFAGVVVEVGKMNGLDGVENNGGEEWLTRLLSWVPQEETGVELKLDPTF